MSRFSNALQSALEEIRETQTSFAQRSGIHTGLLNKYMRGKVDCGAANLQSIARALPERQRADVVTAWLRDQVPEVAAGLVAVLTNKPRLNEYPTPEPLAPALQSAVEYLVARARDHSEIGDLLIDLARALRGDQRV